MNKPIPAYWFGQADADADGVVRLGHGDGRAVRVGETLTVDGNPVLCDHGLHASRRVLDALRYGNGPVLACVRLSGQIAEGDDKLAGTARETVWLGDVSGPLHRFACDVAERVLQAEQAVGREPNPRSWAAIAVKRRWLAGEATDAELVKAAWTAREAAEGAARAAARAADVAARGAAWTAVAAAEAAAWTVAWGAAAGAAGDQERAWQEAHLRALLREAGVPIWEEAAR